MLTITVLGSSCPNCKKAEAVARQAVAGLAVEAEITARLTNALATA